MTNTINYNGRMYNLETIEGYYFDEVALAVEDEYRDTPQEFFDRYIQLDPEFTKLFDYDINPIN